jgi:hypothetical protein
MEHGMRIALVGMERDACTTDGHADAHRGSLSAAAPCCLPPLCACCRVASARALLRQWQQRNGRTVSTPLPPLLPLVPRPRPGSQSSNSSARQAQSKHGSRRGGREARRGARVWAHGTGGEGV